MPCIRYEEPIEKTFYVPPGDYPLRVIAAEMGVVASGKLAGSQMIKLKLQAPNCEGTVFDNLIFNENTAWKINAFLKSIGRAPGVGVELDIDQKWLNAFAVGSEGIATLEVEDYVTKENKTRKKNVLVRWISNAALTASVAQPTKKPDPTAADLSISEESIPF